MDNFDVEMLTRGLIGTMTIQDFNREVRERRTVKFTSAIDADVAEELYNLSRLESVLAREAVPASYVDVIINGFPWKLQDLQQKSGESSLEIVTDHIRRGATIRISDLQKFDGRLDRLIREIKRYFAAQSQVNAYLTPRTRTGFAPHFDITDVFIVQCMGRKEWQIFHNYTNNKKLPLPDTAWDPDRFRPEAPAEAITLSPGDVLYLPRGVMHAAFCAEQESMHLTISIAPLTLADMLVRQIKHIAENDVELRRRLPWSMDSGDREFDALTLQLRERLTAVLDKIDVRGSLTAERRSLHAEPDNTTAGILRAAVTGPA